MSDIRGEIARAMDALDKIAALATEQSAPPVPPEEVWTDGDVMQYLDNGDTWRRKDGKWQSVDTFGMTLSDDLTQDVAKGYVRVLRQQSTGIGGKP